MALRLKYALVDDATIEVEPPIERAVAAALAAARAGREVLVLPTYTAMLAMRRELQRQHIVSPFWAD
jgi:predicted transcriptional regulator